MQQAMPHSPTAVFPPSTPKDDIDHDQSFSERSIDEAVDRSSGALSPTSPAPIHSTSIEEQEGNVYLQYHGVGAGIYMYVLLHVVRLWPYF